MSPIMLNTSAPFAISGFSIQVKFIFGLLMTYTKHQLLTLLDHLVPTLESPNFWIFLGY